MRAAHRLIIEIGTRLRRKRSHIVTFEDEAAIVDALIRAGSCVAGVPMRSQLDVVVMKPDRHAIACDSCLLTY